jgi:hypothetical protein
MNDLTPGTPTAPADFVPVEHRILGLDKRTIVPSLAVLLVAILFSVVIPSIDGAVKTDDPIAAGDVIDLDGKSLTFVPAKDWNLESGVRLGTIRSTVPAGSKTVLTNGETVVTVATGKFSGTPTELLRQVNKINKQLDALEGLGASSKRVSVTTRSGIVGVLDAYTTLERKGIVAAFVVPVPNQDAAPTSVGVEIVAVGSADSLKRDVDEIGEMIESLRLSPTSQGSAQ